MIRRPLMVIGLLSTVLSLCGWGWWGGSKKPSLPEFTPTVQVNKLWETSIGNGTGGQYLQLPPSVQGNTVYAVSYKNKVAAVDANTGNRLWEANLKKTPLTSGPGVGENLVILGTGNGQVIALQQSNGSEVWRKPVLNEVLASPYITGKYVLINGQDGKLSALAARDGSMVWDYTEPMPNVVIRSSSEPQVQGDTVIVGFADGRLAALRLHDGELRWQQQVAFGKGSSAGSRMVDILADPIIKGDMVYTAAFQGKVAALSLATGQLVWQREISAVAGIAVDDKAIYVPDTQGQVWALDRKNGKVLWQQTALQGRLFTGPAIVGDTVALADDQGYVHWLSRQNGNLAARIKADSKGIWTTPISVGNALYVYTNGGRLVKYQLG